MTQNTANDKVEVRKEYYESGDLWYETPYVNGKEHGISRGYYETGAIEWMAPYVDGKMHGIKKLFNKDRGNIEYLLLYKKGQRANSIKT